MAADSKIEWCDHTFNPWIGCTKVSPACDHCYAERSTPSRTLGVTWGAGQPRRRTSDANWALPLRWNARAFYECTYCGWRGFANDPEYAAPRKGCIHDLVLARQRVFCASLADVFDNEVPVQWRRDLFHLIGDTPNLDWLLLTKRIGNVMRMAQDVINIREPLPSNVWLGATICNQAEADRDIPKLLAVPARVRFLSMEPLLGPVSFEGLFANAANIADGTNALEVLDWVIVGGESGPGARPLHPDWARSLRDQCQAAEVPFFMKQLGGLRDKRGGLEELPDDLRIREFPRG
jgi:protein gp37